METKRKIEQLLLIGLIAAVVLGSGLVLLPFISSLLWASILCFSTWPLFERLAEKLKGRRTLAATLMCLAIALLVVGPFVIVGSSLADNVARLTRTLYDELNANSSTAPTWLTGIPWVGATLGDYWLSIAAAPESPVQQLRSFIPALSKWALAQGLALGRGVGLLVLSVFVAFFVYRDGVSLAEHLSAGLTRLAGTRGEELLRLAGNTIRGVVYGILGTALAQGILAAIGFLIAGVPGALLLGLLTFFFSALPMGPPLIWIPSTIWLYSHDQTGMAVFLALWGVLAVSSVDNFLKPYLISQGSALPFVLVLFGVLGGLSAFGLLGVFLGPTLLAVAFTLLRDWTRRAKPLPALAKEG